jgi:ribonuclease HI
MKSESNINSLIYKVFTDGGSRGNPGKAASAFLIYSPQDEVICSETNYLGLRTNNFAEYRALLMALRKCSGLGIRKVEVFSDSELMVRQVLGIYRVKEPTLLDLYQDVRSIIIKFDSFKITHIKRSENKFADALVNKKLDEYK